MQISQEVYKMTSNFYARQAFQGWQQQRLLKVNLQHNHIFSCLC